MVTECSRSEDFPLAVAPSPLELQLPEPDLPNPQQLLQFVLNALPQRVFWKDRQSRYLGANQTFAEDAGLTSPEQLIGKNDFDLYNHASAELYRADDLAVMVSNQRRENYYEPQETLEGKKRWLKTSKMPLRDDAGNVIGIFGTYEDITEQQRRLEVLQNIARGVAADTGEAFFASLVQHLAQALEMEYAFVAEVVPGQKLRTIAVYGDGKELNNFEYFISGTPCAKVVSNQICVYSEGARYLFPQATTLQKLWIEGWIGIPLVDSGGQVLGLMAIMSPAPLQNTQLMEEVLTIFATRASSEIERRQAQKVLEEREQFLRSIYEGIDSCVFVVDVIWPNRSAVMQRGPIKPEFRFVGLNPSHERTTGLSTAQVQGRSPREVLPADMAAQVEQNYHTCVVAEHPITYEEELIFKGRPTHWITTLTPQRNASGKICRLIGTGLEITARKLAERALQDLNQQLEKRVQQRTHELACSEARVRRQEQQFRSLVENSPDQVLRLDRRWRYVYLNPKAIEKNPDYAAAGWLHKTITQVPLPGHVSDRWRTMLDRAWQENQEQTLEYRLCIGSVQEEYQAHIVPESDHQQPPHSLLIMIRNITALKQAQSLLRQQVEQERLLLKTTQRVRESLDLDSILIRTANEIRQVLDCDRVLVYRLNPKCVGVVVAESVDSAYPSALGLTYPEAVLPPSICGDYLSGHVSNLSDISRDPERFLDLSKLLESLQVQARLVVPIIRQQSLWGLLILHQCSAPRTWQSWEVRMSQQIADQLSIAIQQASLYQQVQGELIERRQAEQRLKVSLKEKNVLLKEIHHRVKNNLQLISSLLSLQASMIQDQHVLEPFLDSQRRIRVMALIHEQLYRSRDWANIGFADYVQALATGLFEAHFGLNSEVTLQLDVDEVNLGIDLAIPCGLIINELVSNAVKYAFPNRCSGLLQIQFLANHETCQLIVRDDGVGIPITIDIHNTDSLGLQVVCELTEQLDGTVSLNRYQGTQFTITFPQPPSTK